MQITILIIYLILLIGIGIYSSLRVKNTTDYFVAGRKGSVIQVTGSLLATILGGSAILGTINLTTNQGWAASWLLITASLGLIALIPLAKYVKRLGNFTLPELLGKFYGNRAKNFASIIIPIAWTGIVAAQIIASAKIANAFFSLPYTEGVVISAVLFIFYTLIGGQISILKTDFLQILLIIGGLATTCFFVMQKTEWQIPENHLAFPFNSGFNPLNLFVLVMTYATTYMVGPDIYSRLFCSKDEKTATRSVILTVAILLPLAFLIVLPGIAANSFYPNFNHSHGSILVPLVNDLLPNWASGLMIAAILSAVMSSADTTLLTAAIIITDPLSVKIKRFNSLKLSRIMVVIIGAISLIIALKITSIIQALLIALTFFSGAFIIPTLVGLLRLKINSSHAILAMGTGGLVALTGKLISIYGNSFWGNWIIISAFAVNAIILFFPKKLL
ncbi:sodium:solute symporter family protein [Prolixibacteraceae bacterium JC049]|nr:sodium:solute symporter family protein [Prolixibacteraceae bacterium JC049]